MKSLLQEIKNCRVCQEHLPLGANPVMRAGKKSKIVIIGQAPGKVVHETGIPWNDKSGDNLRAWMGIDKTIFYDPEITALMPMGFCYPGTGSWGDIPPRPECAPLWHPLLWQQMKSVKLVLLVGSFSQKYYLGNRLKPTLTESVRNFREYLPRYFVLPHPSPRNNIWQAKNSWFPEEVLPELKMQIQHYLK